MQRRRETHMGNEWYFEVHLHHRVVQSEIGSLQRKFHCITGIQHRNPWDAQGSYYYSWSITEEECTRWIRCAKQGNIKLAQTKHHPRTATYTMHRLPQLNHTLSINILCWLTIMQLHREETEQSTDRHESSTDMIWHFSNKARYRDNVLCNIQKRYNAIIRQQ